MRLKRRKSNVPQLWPIKNFWTNLKRKVDSNNYRPKDRNWLMAKARTELKPIETKDPKAHSLPKP
jgi:hypothetical protein